MTESARKLAKPLPDGLANRYRAWRDSTYQEKKELFRKLVDEGQKPESMIVSCCDSRVLASSIFGADPGDCFIHRNIANLVPPHDPDGTHHGTAAAIEYGVKALKVQRLIVMGHSQCGGAKACLDMCSRGDSDIRREFEFAPRWLEILRPGYERISKDQDEASQLAELERQTVLVSLENLMTYPFVASGVNEGSLSLHGLWNNIREGALEFYDSASGGFAPV